jgi:hypothetical protein
MAMCRGSVVAALLVLLYSGEGKDRAHHSDGKWAQDKARHASCDLKKSTAGDESQPTKQCGATGCGMLCCNCVVGCDGKQGEGMCCNSPHGPTGVTPTAKAWCCRRRYTQQQQATHRAAAEQLHGPAMTCRCSRASGAEELV